ncbi:hypothetical protein B0H14DRAFT_2566707 [Mycena olivaceomarginata]|nr:hypothetical protein B0H14DRAFT_2566707 [Mycena olivaceomarginata]
MTDAMWGTGREGKAGVLEAAEGGRQGTPGSPWAPGQHIQEPSAGCTGSWYPQEDYNHLLEDILAKWIKFYGFARLPLSRKTTPMKSCYSIATSEMGWTNEPIFHIWLKDGFISAATLHSDPEVLDETGDTIPVANIVKEWMYVWEKSFKEEAIKQAWFKSGINLNSHWTDNEDNSDSNSNEDKDLLPPNEAAGPSLSSSLSSTDLSSSSSSSSMPPDLLDFLSASLVPPGPINRDHLSADNTTTTEELWLLILTVNTTPTWLPVREYTLLPLLFSLDYPLGTSLPRPTVALATRPIGAPALADTSVSRYPPSAPRAGEFSMSLPSLKGEVDFGTPEKGSASAGNDYEDGGWTTITRKTSRSHREHSCSSRGSRDSGHSESGDSDTESTIAQATNELSAEDAIKELTL